MAPPQVAGHPLEIVQFHAWRMKEPVSGRRYTVVEIQSRSGDAGYGEGGPATAAEIVEARAATSGRRVTEWESIRARLAQMPAMEAAVNNAMLDLLARSRKIPIYQFLGGPTRFKARLLARLEGADEVAAAGPLERAKRQGFRAFTMPALQRDAMIPKIERLTGGSVAAKRIAVLGLAFKPETDDMRDAPSVDIIKGLVDRGATVVAFDPVAKTEAEKLLPMIEYAANEYDAAMGADALVFVTEWNQFRALDMNRIRESMAVPRIADLRNIYTPADMREMGFEYVGVGR